VVETDSTSGTLHQAARQGEGVRCVVTGIHRYVRDTLGILQADVPDSFRQGGIYAARVLKGEKPEDLPVILSTKYETVLNLKPRRNLVCQLRP
jgi:hypothetical protein